MLKILGIDPGTANCGFSVVSFDKKCKFDIPALGMIKNTLVDLKDDPRLQLDAFGDEIEELIETYNPDAISIERFLIRSFRTPTAEQVTAMIGYLFGAFPNIPIYPYTAVTWKNAAKKVLNLPKNLDPFYKSVHALPHECDAVMLAFHHANALPLLSNKKERNKLICLLEEKTTRPPKRIPKAKALPKRKVKKK